MSAPVASPPAPDAPRPGPGGRPVLAPTPRRLLRLVAMLRDAPDTLFALSVGALLAALTLDAGGGLQLSPTTRAELILQGLGATIGTVAILASGAATGRDARQRAGIPALALFALLTALTAVSIIWSVDPSETWLEASRTLAYLATFAGGLALVRLAGGRWSGLLGAVLIACAIVSTYALATKVFPGWLAPDETYARLREPFGYWNAVGLTAAMALPACLWLGARRTGHAALGALAYPLAGLLLVAILLSYSRGSLLAAAAGVGFWFAVVPLRLRGVTVLATSALGAIPVGLWAFAQDGLTTDRAPLDLRASAGHELGVALLAMTVVLLAAGLAIGFSAARRAPAASTRRAFGLAILVGLALVPVAGAAALSLSERGLGGSISKGWNELTDPNASTPANDPGRLTAVGSVRARYYNEALKIGRAHKAVGVGAGGYGVARLRFRNDDLDVRHAHGYAFQTFADLGIAGLLVSLALLGAWGIAAAQATGLTRRRPGEPRRPFGPERIGLLTLLAIVITFGVHSTVDWTWFIPGPTIIALLCAAWVAGRGRRESWTQWLSAGERTTATEPLRARVRSGLRDRERAALAGALVLISIVMMWSTWQPLRGLNVSQDALELVASGKVAQAREKARHAHDIDPLSVEPLFDLAVIESTAGRKDQAREALEQAVQLQPRNPTTWLRLADYTLNVAGDANAAVKALGPALYLDPRSPSGVTLFLDASRRTSGSAPAAASPVQP